jgi:hypothetical protein
MSENQKKKEATAITPSQAAGESWCERPKADKIPCPAMLTFYNNGMMNPDEDGNVTTAELDKVLESVGVSAFVRGMLGRSADDSDGLRDCKFDLFALRDSSLDHSGSTGVRDPEVDPEKLETALLKFSENGRMYVEHFAAAANHGEKHDPGIKGTLTQTLDFAALLELFGRVDEDGKRYLTDQDVRGLWMDGKFPEGWQPRPNCEVGAGDLALGVAKMVLGRVVDAVGL